MPTETIYRAILAANHIEYALCDAERRIVEYTPGFTALARSFSGPLRGHPLEEVFDVLTGMEDDLSRLQRKELPEIRLEKIAHHFAAGKEGYLTLTLLPNPPGLIALLVDVTPEGQLEQRITQQRNQLDLLAGQLAAARGQLDDLLHRVMPRAMADRLVANPKSVRLGGDWRFASILFADIRGYSAIAKRYEPTKLMDILNDHFKVLGRVILDHGGVINQYAGDMIMASFGALDDSPDHALRAMQSAQAMQRALRDWSDRDEWAQFGIGINTGPVVAGFLGFEDRFDFTVIGETTNIAFRFCSRAEGGQILIGPNTRQLLPVDAPVRSIGTLELKGVPEPVETFAVLTD